jgi:uncharacterized protein
VQSRQKRELSPIPNGPSGNFSNWVSKVFMFHEDRYVSVYNQTKKASVALRVRVADSILSRLVGLLGTRSLKPGSGMWLFPASGIHTIGMMFALDVVLIDKGLKVVGLREAVQPFSVVWPASCTESVLELPAHTIFTSRTEVGDQLLIERCEAGQAGNGPTSAGTEPMSEVR